MNKKTFYKITGVLYISLILIGLLLIGISNISLFGKAKYDFMYIIDSIGIIVLALGIISLLIRVIMFAKDRSLPPIFFSGPISKVIEKKKAEAINTNPKI